MADREERIAIVNETIALCKTNARLREDVAKSISGQKLYFEEDSLSFDGDKRYDHTWMKLTDARTMEAAEKYTAQPGKKICVLNFASAVTPGGGVLRGTTAQEESICRISSLYPALCDEATAGAFYKSHLDKIKARQMTRKNTDDCIFTPGVTVLREDTFDCTLLSEDRWYQVDVITCAAPDQRVDQDWNTYYPLLDEEKQDFLNRWRRILTVAAIHQEDILILGAFGCGVFANRPDVVATAAKQACAEFDGCFEGFDFAIPDALGKNYRVFDEILS